LDDEWSSFHWRINDSTKIEDCQVKAGDEICTVECEESGFSEVVERRAGVIEEEINSDSNLVAFSNQSWEVENRDECGAGQSVEIFDNSFKVAERTHWGHSASDTGIKDVVDIHLSSHHQEGSRWSESQIEVHDFLLADGVGLLLGNVGFAFGAINAEWISVLINDLSGSHALLAVWISISPEYLIRTSALVASGCIPNEAQVRSALALARLALDVVEVVGERLTLVLLTATGCKCNSDSNKKDEEERLDRHYNTKRRRSTKKIQEY